MVSLGTIIIGVIAGLVLQFIVGVNFKSILQYCVSIAERILFFTIPVWALLIFVIVSVIVLFIIKTRLKKSLYPDWHKFTKMEHDGHFFEWNYKGDIPCNFVELCGKCGCQLGYGGCPNCGNPQETIFNSISSFMIEDNLKKVVKSKIETGEYKKCIQRCQRNK